MRKYKKMVLSILTALVLCGCGDEEAAMPDDGTQAEAAMPDITVLASEEAALDQTEEAGKKEERGMRETKETMEGQTEYPVCSFADFSHLEFFFLSGVGGWSTGMFINADGSFSGRYSDRDAGTSSVDYPHGTLYLCDFSGHFTEPEMVNDYTYSMWISEIHFEEEVDKKEIKDEIRYCYTDAYGLDGAERILIYMPGAPIAELPEEFRRWVKIGSGEKGERLTFYGLYNEAQGYGFSSVHIVDQFMETLCSVEAYTDSLEASISHDPLDQQQLNRQSENLYEEWDYALNQLWRVLKRIKDEEAMKLLTEEERKWIAKKEQAVKDAGAEFEGGSMQPLVMNLEGARLTKERVYELLKLLQPLD